jgi:hypothetical protein
MTIFNLDFSRIATAAVGALVLSTACVAAAVAPARAVETDRGVQLAHAQPADQLTGRAAA